MSYVHERATTVTGPLEPKGQRPGADSGDPQISSIAFDAPPDVRVGVWEREPGGWAQAAVHIPDAKGRRSVQGLA